MEIRLKNASDYEWNISWTLAHDHVHEPVLKEGFRRPHSGRVEFNSGLISPLSASLIFEGLIVFGFNTT